jgi:ribulose 1,5-bisphosphate synthetase/thiazole synthase
MITEPEKQIPVLVKTDVVVAGAGPSGFAAAVAAARNGSAVMLVEKENYVGGLLTCLPILGFCNYQGQQVIYGIADELVQRLVERGGSPGHVVDPRLTSVTVIDTEMTKIVTQQMCEEAGVKLLFHAVVSAPVMKGNRVTGLILECKSGRQAILADVVIDATGDGDVAARAGAEFQIKDRESQQPGNLMFRMDHVDVNKIRLAIAKNPDKARTIPGFGPGADHFLKAKRFVLDGFTEELAQARENGDIPPDYPMRWVIIVTQPREDEVAINMAMAARFQSIDALDLTQAEMEGRRFIPIVVDFLRKYIPGFAHAQLISSHSIMGVRESRRIAGDATLLPEDVTQNRRYEDGVAVASWGLSLGHHPQGKVWDKDYYTKRFPREGLKGCEVRYGCLLPKGVEGLLLAGRCISTTPESQNAIRVMAPCMSIGQAAGTAAAMAIKEGVTPRQIDAKRIRTRLAEQGAPLLTEQDCRCTQSHD